MQLVRKSNSAQGWFGNQQRNPQQGLRLIDQEAPNGPAEEETAPRFRATPAWSEDAFRLSFGKQMFSELAFVMTDIYKLSRGAVKRSGAVSDLQSDYHYNIKSVHHFTETERKYKFDSVATEN